VIRGHKRLSVVAVAVFIVLVTATTLVTAEEPITAAARKDTNPGQVLGSYMTGGQIWSSPAHDGGTVYIGSDDGSLWALDFETLAPKWKVDTGGRVRSIPAVVDGSVYFVSDDGFLYSVATSDGSRSWRFDLQSAGIERVMPLMYPPYAYDYLSSSPTVHEGTVFVGSANGTLYAVEAATGQKKWHFKTGDRIRSTPKIHQKRVYVGSWDHHLYALDVENGKQIWRFNTGGIVQASPAFGDGRVYIGSRTPKVFALDAAPGEPVWEFEHTDGSWVESSGIYLDGVLYMGSSDALTLFAFDGATGDVTWKYRTGGWSWCTPSISGETIYVGAISAYPYSFDGVTLERGLHAVELKTGKPRWVVPTGELPGFVTGGVMSTPLVVNGKVIAGALDNRLIVVAE
jgi:outer membrane protein assembly factor BamB